MRLPQSHQTAVCGCNTEVFSHKKEPGQDMGHSNYTFFSKAGSNPLKNLRGPKIFQFVSLLRGCQCLKGTLKSPELVETKMQTSSGKFQRFCHQLSIRQALMFSCLILTWLIISPLTFPLPLPTWSLFQRILNNFLFSCMFVELPLI